MKTFLFITKGNKILHCIIFLSEDSGYYIIVDNHRDA